MPATLDSEGPAVVVGDRSGHLYAYHLSDGTPVAGWPVLDGTGGPLGDGGYPIDSTPSVAALNGSLDSVFVGLGDARYPRTGGYAAYGPGGQLLWHTSVKAPQTRKVVNGGVAASLTVGDLQGGTDVFAGSLGQKSYALGAASGRRLPGWPFYDADTVFSTAAVADLYDGGQEELVVGGASHHGSADGVQYQNGGHVRILNAEGRLLYDYDTDQEIDSSPAVGPFLAGEATGIVVGTGSYYAGASDTDKLLAFTTRLAVAWTDPLDGLTSSSPALADVCGDGQLDVVEGTDQGPAGGSVYVLDGATGAQLWETSGLPRVIGSVVTADLTGDGYQDLLVPTLHGVYVFDMSCANGTVSGSEVTVLARGLGFQNSPLVTDDPGGSVGITVAGYNGSDQGVIRHYEIAGSDGPTAVGTGSWPMFHHDPSLSGTIPDSGTVTPTDLTAQAGDGQVSLSWTAPASVTPVTGYNLYEATEPGHETGPPANSTPITGTSYTVTGLTNGQPYYFEVTAINGAGEGAPSNQASAVPSAPPPSTTTTTTSSVPS